MAFDLQTYSLTVMILLLRSERFCIICVKDVILQTLIKNYFVSYSLIVEKKSLILVCKLFYGHTVVKYLCQKISYPFIICHWKIYIRWHRRDLHTRLSKVILNLAEMKNVILMLIHLSSRDHCNILASRIQNLPIPFMSAQPASFQIVIGLTSKIKLDF